MNLDQNAKITIWKRDDFTCVYCGKKDQIAIDHIFPMKHKGSDEISNLVTVCKRCNSSKGARFWRYWLNWQEFFSTERETYVNGIIALDPKTPESHLNQLYDLSRWHFILNYTSNVEERNYLFDGFYPTLRRLNLASPAGRGRRQRRNQLWAVLEWSNWGDDSLDFRNPIRVSTRADLPFHMRRRIIIAAYYSDLKNILDSPLTRAEFSDYSSDKSRATSVSDMIDFLVQTSDFTYSNLSYREHVQKHFAGWNRKKNAAYVDSKARR